MAVLVAALTRESATARVQVWLGNQYAVDRLTSEWTLTEFAAALSVKRRMGAVTEDEHAKAKAYVASLTGASIRVAPVTTIHFRLAAEKATQHSTGLRAGDALHLAICLSERADLCTLDKRLASAGPQLGVATHLL